MSSPLTVTSYLSSGRGGGPERVRAELPGAPAAAASTAQRRSRGGEEEDRIDDGNAQRDRAGKLRNPCREIVEKNVAETRVAVKLGRFLEFAANYPNEPCVHWHLGNLQDREGDRVAARRSYERFLELAPDDPRRSAALRRIGDLAAQSDPR